MYGAEGPNPNKDIQTKIVDYYTRPSETKTHDYNFNSNGKTSHAHLN
jgi:hypothetical protein